MSSFRPLTQNQKRLFWRAMQAACINLGLSTQTERDDYRHKVLFEETKNRHFAQLNRTIDFDRVMTRLAKDAGDWQTASKFASGDEYRLAVMVKICCSQIMQLKGLPDGSDAAKRYLAGILEQSRIPCGTNVTDSSFWMDISKDSLRIVFQILDTHRRRLLAGYKNAGALEGFHGFDETMVYMAKPDGTITLCFNNGYYDSYNSIKVNVRAS